MPAVPTSATDSNPIMPTISTLATDNKPAGTFTAESEERFLLFLEEQFLLEEQSEERFLLTEQRFLLVAQFLEEETLVGLDSILAWDHCAMCSNREDNKSGDEDKIELHCD